MEPKFQTSFIPKNSLVNNAVTVEPTSSFNLSLAPILATVFLILSIILSIGSFLYQRYLNKNISEANQSIVLARQAFEPKVISDLLLASDQIKSVKTILDNHIVVSNLFALLQSLTIPNVRFEVFVFDRKPDGKIGVTIEGQSITYPHVARQAEILASSDFLHNIFFSDLSLNDKGVLNMKFTMDVDQGAISYKEALGKLSLFN
jgi:hypothetical protein